MASQTSDRQRMSNDLRELAKLAKPESGRPVHRFEMSSESSGFFDLSALLASEAAKSKLELAARAAPPPLPRVAARPFDVPSHERMVSGAFEASEDTASGRSSRSRKTVYALFSLASVGLVGFLALTLARHPPPAAAVVPETPAALAPAPIADPAPQPATTAAAPATATAPAATAADGDSTTPPATAAADLATPSRGTRKVVPAARVHVAAASPTPSPAHAAAARPAVIPASHPAPAGNDSLMDLIKKSVATGK